MTLFERVFLRLLGVMGHHPGIVSKKYIKQFLPDDPIIVECGAYDGTDTLEMARLWPKSKIYSFEPISALFSKLCNNTRSYKNITCYEFAVGNRTGTQKMYVSGGEGKGSSSLLEPCEHLRFHPRVTFNTTIDIKTISLDDWTKEHGITKVDFLWLDTQGNELAILQASESILHTVCAIYTEVSLKETYKGVALYPELRDWLCAKGFKVMLEKLPWPDMGNVLFVRENFIRR
jgi:FkbM family methyltransferase